MHMHCIVGAGLPGGADRTVEWWDTVLANRGVKGGLATHNVLGLVRHNSTKGDDVSPAQAGLPLARHFRRNEHLSMRSSWTDPEATWVAMKGRVPWGVGSDPGHPHDDLGSFVFEMCGERWADDLGAEGYDVPEYFDLQVERWAIYRGSWAGHNVLTLREHAPSEAQPLPSAGLMKNLSATAAFFALKLSSSSDDDQQAAVAAADDTDDSGVGGSLNLTDIYNGHAEVTRTVRLQGQTVTLRDAVVAGIDGEARWSMHLCMTSCGVEKTGFFQHFLTFAQACLGNYAGCIHLMKTSVEQRVRVLQGSLQTSPTAPLLSTDPSRQSKAQAVRVLHCI